MFCPRKAFRGGMPWPLLQLGFRGRYACLFVRPVPHLRLYGRGGEVARWPVAVFRTDRSYVRIFGRLIWL